jgi:UDP-N-acetylmuramate--alanine ligase
MGIGGAGMSGIAQILSSRGVAVSGCDAKESRRTAALRAIGIDVHIGHAPDHLSEVDSVVVSTAIPVTNKERQVASEKGIPVLSRAQALGAIMGGFTGIAITGTHGKTTTTSMFTVALQNCGDDPSFAIGSELNESGANAHLGSGKLFVVEADESDGAFLHLQPQVAIVTNIEPDHLDHWGTFEAIEQAFLDFAVGIGHRGGFVVACHDDPGSLRMSIAAKEMGVDVRTYGESADSDYQMIDAKSDSHGWSFDTALHGVRQGRIHLKVPGHHNALNAQAVFAAMLGMGYPAQQVVAGLEAFSGTRRRFDFKGEVNGIRVFDDYAHHPTEIAATLRAAREVVGPGRLIVAFQAHHYYRTAMFTKEFGQSLGLADQVVVLEVFAPGEEPIPGASGQTMASNVPLADECVVFEPSWSHVADHLIRQAVPGDIIMTLGAGDIGLIASEVVERLRDRQEVHGA